MVFRDRTEAGRRLGERLTHLADARPVVLGLPRGGVVVAAAVAEALGAVEGGVVLDVILVRKLGVPHHAELAMGAIGEGGVQVVNAGIITSARVTPRELEEVARAERAELERRAERYRGGRPMPELEGATVIVVDDGIATGATARAALEVVRAHSPERLVLAVPVAAPDSLAALEPLADDVVVVDAPAYMSAVGGSYRHFEQTSDDEVVSLLERSRRGGGAP